MEKNIGKVYIVSGANSGIGKACVENLLQNSACVIGIDLKQSSVIERRYVHYSADIRDEQRIMEITDEIEKKQGRIDGLANCAGVYANSKPF